MCSRVWKCNLLPQEKESSGMQVCSNLKVLDVAMKDTFG